MVTNLLGYDFEIIYKNGKISLVADALSINKDETKDLLCVISIM